VAACGGLAALVGARAVGLGGGDRGVRVSVREPWPADRGRVIGERRSMPATRAHVSPERR
jgi:hypothetical protein